MQSQIASGPYEPAPRLYHIGDVAALTGLTEHALRAWERVELLAPQRSPAGVRLYTEDDLARIRLISRTLDTRRLSRRVVAELLRLGELRPDAADYAHGGGTRRRRGQVAGEGARRPDDEASRTQRLLAAVTRVGGAVASGRPLAEVLAVICRQTCVAFGVSDAVLWLVEPEQQAQQGAPRRALAAAAAYGPHSRAALDPIQSLRIALDDPRSASARAIRTRQGIIINALDTAPDTHPDLLALLPGAALLVAPLLRADGEPVGALSLREALEPERFDASDLEQVRLFATQATIAIETARLHEGMRAAQQEAEAERARWRAIVDNAPELVMTCDTEGHITFLNAAYEQLASHIGNLDEQVSQAASLYGVARLDGTEVYSMESLPLPRALKENRVVRGVELLQRTGDGGQRLISWDAAPVRGPDGTLLGAVTVGRDITEEQRRSEREHCLATIMRAAAGTARAGESSRVEQALRALVEHSEMAMIAATLYTYDEELRVLTRAGRYGLDKAAAIPPVVPLDSRHHWWEPVTRGPMYSAEGMSTPAWLMDIAPSVRRHTNRQAWATVPLRSGAAFLGVLAVGLNTPHVWDDAEREWLEGCAGAVALALANDRLYAAAQRRADELEAVLDAVDVGITTYAADGRMLVRNAAAVAITGRAAYVGALEGSAEAYGLRNALTGELVALEDTPLMRALRGERVRDALLVMRDGEGRDRVTRSSSEPVRDAKGQVVAAVTVFSEVPGWELLEQRRGQGGEERRKGAPEWHGDGGQ